MLKNIKYVLLITLPTLIALSFLLELFFRFVIPASNPPRGYFDEETLIYRFMLGPSDGLFTIGALAQQRGRWHINNHGWNNPVDYYPEKSRPRVAVIGDSYIEAFQVDSDKSYPALINSATEEYDVYSFGISGAPLSQYLHMTRYVNRAFDPDVLVINLILNDFAESIYDGTAPHWLKLKVSGDSVMEVQPRKNPAFIQYSKTKQILRHSALVRYLFFNLQMPGLMMRLSARNDSIAENTDISLVQSRRNEIGTATRYVINQIKAESPGRRIIYVIDAPKQSIYAGKIPSEQVRYIYSAVESGATESGSEFLNLWPAMQEEFQTNGKKFNSEYDGHWDEYGHAFVAHQVLPILIQNAASGMAR